MKTGKSITNKLMALLLSFALLVTMISSTGITALAVESPQWADVAATAIQGTDYTVDETGDNYKVFTALGLAYISDRVNTVTSWSVGKTITLAGNIDLSGKEWKPIGEVTDTNGFDGDFNGGGYSISGLTVTTNSKKEYINDSLMIDICGLFGVINAAGVVSDLSVNGTIQVDLSASRKTFAYAGGIAGQNKGIIANCTNNASVTIPNCYSYVEVGGIAGSSDQDSVVEGCKNTGNISAYSSIQSVQAGGIIGESSGSVRNCVNTGTVAINASNGSNAYAGGILGYAFPGCDITNCYNTSTGSISAYATGDMKQVERASVGGIAGGCIACSENKIKNCYSIASSLSASASYNTDRYIGGLVGYQVQSQTITNSYWKTGGGATAGVGAIHSPTQYSSCGFFLDNTGALTQDTSSGSLVSTDLLTALNDGLSSGDFGWETVEGQNDGYPVFMQPYSVKYDENGGSGSVPATAYNTSGQTVNVSFSTLPTRLGYSFLGWDTDNNATSATYTQAGTNTFTMGTENVKLFAVWSPLTYAVTNTLTNMTFSGSGSATCGTNYTATLTAGENYSLPASITVKAGSATLTPERDYTYNSSTGVISIAGTKITGDITISANGDEKEFSVANTLTNITSSGSGSATYGTNYFATLTAGANYNLPANITVKVGSATLTPNRDYSYNSRTGVISIAGTKITGDITITASGIAKNYSITYNLNGGAQTGAPVNYTFGTGVTLPTPTKTGYTFGGWFDNASLIGSAVSDITVIETGDKIYWAKWSANSYTITYILNGGSQAAVPVNYTFGTGATLPTPTKSEYSFKGWYENPGSAGDAVSSISVTEMGDKTYWAKWSLNAGNPDDAPKRYIQGTSSADGSNLATLQYSDINGIDSGNMGITVGNTTLNVPAAIVSGLISDDSTSILQLTKSPVNSDLLNTAAGLLPSQNSIVASISLGLVKIDSNGVSTPIHKLGGKIKITLTLTDEQLTKISDVSKAKLYYLNTDANTLEQVEATFDLSSKTVVFYTDHFSTYIVETGYISTGAVQNPKTGHTSTPIIPISLFIAGSTGYTHSHKNT